MDESFFERPILNSPYARPVRHWELDEDGQSTNRIVEARRRSELITTVPSRRGGGARRARENWVAASEMGCLHLKERPWARLVAYTGRSPWLRDTHKPACC